MVARSGIAASARRSVAVSDGDPVHVTSHMQAVTTESGCIRSASSSGDGGDQVLAYKAQCAEETDLRGLREEVYQLVES